MHYLDALGGSGCFNDHDILLNVRQITALNNNYTIIITEE